MFGLASRLAAWLAEPQRALTVAWLVGVVIVGTARAAHADVIVGPDLTDGAPKTLYESYDFADYKLSVKPDEENSDWFGLSEAILEVVGFINNLILWIFLGVLYGALSLLEWFLNLTIYRDAAPQIDTATQMIASRVFWPLIAATVAIGAFIAYARWRGEGRGFLSDFGWVVAAGSIAAGFAAGPSSIMNEVDSVRQGLATGVIAGSSQFSYTAGNPTGFPTPQIGGDAQKAGTRKLVDTMWNTYGATGWCLAEFRSLDVCKVAGHHALAGDDTWKRWMDELDNGGAPPEFGKQIDWIRGQDLTRTAYLLVLALISIPMGVMLLRLTVSGLVATVGFLLMLVVGLVFLVFWPIPGWFRQTGTHYWIRTLGMELQVLFITVSTAGVVVVSTSIATLVGKYGIFVVATLNLALLIAAARLRAWLDAITTVSGGSSMGFAGFLLARSMLRTAAGAGSGLLHGGARLAGAGLRPVPRPPPVSGPGWRRGTWLPRFAQGGTGRAANLASPEAEPTMAAWPSRWTRRSPANLETRALPRGAPPTGTEVVVRDQLRAVARRVPSGVDVERPVVVDHVLERNVTAAQARIQPTRRVWVNQFGEGLSAVEPRSALDPEIAKRAGKVYRIRGSSPVRNPRKSGSS